MNPYVKFGGVLASRIISNIFRIFPLRNNRIVFNSYGGKNISCNPKYIYEEMRKRYGPKYEYIWCIKDRAQREQITKEQGVKAIGTMNLSYLYYILTSKVYINNGIAPSYLSFRNRQCIIGTWHGGGSYKKGGIETLHSAMARREFQFSAENVTYVISSGRAFSEETLKHSFLIPESKILEYGMPRNDMFFSCMDGQKERIQNALAIGSDRKILLFAPTFRSKLSGLETELQSYESKLDYLMLMKELHNRFGGSWTILYRSHYYCDGRMRDAGILDVSDYPDMQELLLISDILITDYSSSIWDFSLKQPLCPCFIFAEDLEHYRDGRGFYTPITKWPFPLAENNEQLAGNIRNFDYGRYCHDVRKHLDDLGSFERGTASRRTAELIDEICSGTAKGGRAE